MNSRQKRQRLRWFKKVAYRFAEITEIYLKEIDAGKSTDDLRKEVADLRKELARL